MHSFVGMEGIPVSFEPKRRALPLIVGGIFKNDFLSTCLDPLSESIGFSTNKDSDLYLIV